MKKILSFTAILIALCSAGAFAQNPNPCNINATIHHFPANEFNPREIGFFPQEPINFNTDSIFWNWGDGTSTSMATFVTHTFPSTGAYTVCVRIVRRTSATAPPCIAESCTTVTILQQAPGCGDIQPNFTVAAGTSPNTYMFTNTSTGVQPSDSVFWYFGDGTMIVGGNPVHTFPNVQPYTVCIKIKRIPPTPNFTACVKQFCRIVPETPACTIQATFSSERINSAPAYTYQFTNTTAATNANDQYLWNFGDGTSSTLQNPQHQYVTPGSYTVCLLVRKVFNGQPSNCASDTCRVISIQSNCTLQASYTVAAQTANPRIINFTNTTTPHRPLRKCCGPSATVHLLRLTTPSTNMQCPEGIMYASVSRTVIIA